MTMRATCLNEGEPEDVIRTAAVDEVLDLHAGPRPHAEDVPRSSPTLALGNEVDPVLFDVERLRRRRVVNYCQVL